MWGISELSEELLNSQDGLFSMEFAVSSLVFLKQLSSKEHKNR